MPGRTAPPRAPGGIPGLRHAVALLRDPLGTLQRARSVGEVAEIRLGPFRVLVVNSPELIRCLLVDRAKEFSRGRLMTKAGEYLGKGVLCSDGDLHLRQRRLTQPAFHRHRLAGYATTMAERCAAATSSWQPGQRIDWYRTATSLVSDIVGSTLVSGEQGRQIAEAFHASIPAITRDFMWQVASPARWLERLPTAGNRRIRSLFDRMGTAVEQAVAAEPACPGDRADLLSMLVTARDSGTGERMSAGQVRSEMMNILTAAIETTSSTLAWLFYEIGRNPDIERRLHAEIDAVPADRPVALDDLAALPYTRRVID